MYYLVFFLSFCEGFFIKIFLVYSSYFITKNMTNKLWFQIMLLILLTMMDFSFHMEFFHCMMFLQRISFSFVFHHMVSKKEIVNICPNRSSLQCFYLSDSNIVSPLIALCFSNYCDILPSIHFHQSDLSTSDSTHITAWLLSSNDSEAVMHTLARNLLHF